MNHNAFREFLDNHDLSRRKFAFFCGEKHISKTTIQRLAIEGHGGLNADYIKSVTPFLMENVARFLRGNGVSEQDLNQTMLDIFEEEYQPMITNRQRLEYEVLEWFGLDRDPFALEADPRSAEQAFNTKEIDRVARRIEDAINYQGFLAVLGQVGAGKTSLKNRVAAKLKEGKRTHLIFPKFAEMKKVSPGGIVHVILEHFGQSPRARLVLAQRQLEAHLEHLSDQGFRVALCFDECHRLHESTLTALKNFYELGTGGYERYLGLVLLGQPQFRSKLESFEFREIAERLEIVEMPSLSKYAAAYLGHRLQMVGGDIDALFEKAAIEMIARQASTPLAIGNLANKALAETAKMGEKRVLSRFLEREREPFTRRRGAA